MSPAGPGRLPAVSRVALELVTSDTIDLDIERALEEHRRELTGYCYRMLGSGSEAEDAVQETFIRAWKNIDRFEGRSSLKTWVYRILVNKAKTRGVREARTVPFSALAPEGEESVVPEDRFRGADDLWPGHWASPPRPLDTVPEERLLAREARGRIAEALETLPESQRVVVTLRDVAGWDSDEVCDALGLSEGNQRVLLHRGRAKLRAALERYLEED